MRAANDAGAGAWSPVRQFTTVDETFKDETPPEPPVGLKASGLAADAWSPTGSFTLAWTDPADPSGIARVHFKLGEPPSGADDESGSVAAGQPLTIEVKEEGKQSVYVWLEDGTGNVDHARWTEVTLGFDGTAPETPVLGAPSAGAWLNVTRVTFTWAAAGDPLSGLSYYLLCVDGALADSTAATELSHSLASGAHQWEVVEGGGAETEARLSFAGVADCPGELELSLLDVDGKIAIPLKVGTTYPVTVGGRDRQRRFRIVAGNTDYVRQSTGEFQAVPTGSSLAQNWPNPFNAQTTIAYQLSQQERLRLAVYDALGREVAVLVDGVKDPGYFSVTWDGTDHSGRVAGSGVFFYMLETRTRRLVRKMVILH